MSSKRPGRALAAAFCLAAGIAAADDRIIINPRSAYPEGPVVVGNVVYYAEMGTDRVIRWDGHANTPIWSRPGCGPTSVARGAGDTLIVLCHIEWRLARITTSGQKLEIIDRDAEGQPFMDPNASINDAKGGVYLSSSGTFSPTASAEGAVLYLDPSGKLRRVAEGIHYANGVALSADGKILFVSEHLSRRILAYDVEPDGGLTGRRVFLRLDDVVGSDPKRSWEVGPDGLAMDTVGNLVVAEYGGGRLIIVDKAAQLKAIVRVPEQFVTAPALIDGGRRIFVTAPVSLFDPKAYGSVYSVANPVYGKD